MELTIALADTKLRIRLWGDAERALTPLRQQFEGFLCPDREGDAELQVRVLPYTLRSLPLAQVAGVRVIEQRLPAREVAAWLKRLPDPIPDLRIGERTIATFFLNGLLLFDPDGSRGCILLKAGKGSLWPLYRLCWMQLAQLLGERRGCFVHGAALVHNGQGYLFVGPSGAGKTTLSQRFGGAMVLSDEGPVLREREGKYLLYPSPYRQTPRYRSEEDSGNREGVPLAGLLFLHQASRTFLEGLTKREALAPLLLRQALFLPHLSPTGRAHLFHLFCDACDRIPLYNLHVSLDQDIWEAIDASDRRDT